jgi:hypothetical protein
MRQLDDAIEKIVDTHRYHQENSYDMIARSQLRETCTTELTPFRKDVAALIKTLEKLQGYEDLNVPVVCPRCAPNKPDNYNQARLDVHEALATLKVDE